MKISPFDYVKSINQKKLQDDLSGYNPFLTNRSFAYHLDTVLLAEEMNQCHSLGPELQYDFYYYAVRKGSRFGFPKKQEDDPNLQVVMEYYKFSKQKAIEALRILTPEDISDIIISMDRGGT